MGEMSLFTESRLATSESGTNLHSYARPTRRATLRPETPYIWTADFLVRAIRSLDEEMAETEMTMGRAKAKREAKEMARARVARAKMVRAKMARVARTRVRARSKHKDALAARMRGKCDCVCAVDRDCPVWRLLRSKDSHMYCRFTPAVAQLHHPVFI